MGFKRHWLAGAVWLLAGGLSAGEVGVGLQAGLFVPGAGVRDDLFVGKAGLEVALSLSMPLDARHEVRAEGAYAACWDRDPGRAQAPWERHGACHRPPRASLDRLFLGLGYRRYLAEGPVRPFVSVGLGTARFASRVERFMPRDIASCHRQNHHHPAMRPWAEPVAGREPRSLGPQAHCGGMAWCPVRSTGWMLSASLGMGCVLGERMEVALRHAFTPAYGRTLGAWTLSAGIRF